MRLTVLPLLPAILLLLAAPALAQQAKPPAGASLEMRPIFATVPDIIEGKRLADDPRRRGESLEPDPLGQRRLEAHLLDRRAGR